jgi:hypothetical protein
MTSKTFNTGTVIDSAWLNDVNAVTYTTVPALSTTVGGHTTTLGTKADDTAVVHKTGAEAVAGVKTFSSSPVVPTPAVRDNSTNAASTAYVDGLQNAGSRVLGLVGNVNATTPLTKYDMFADVIVLRNSTGATVVRYNAPTTTCDLGLAGSAANGRDQSAAFSINSWIHLYWVWNGTTLATLASTTLPTLFTGSTLPAGYTHWAYATTIRWNSSSNIIPGFPRGSKFFYDTDAVATTRALSGWNSNSFYGCQFCLVSSP